MRKLALVAVFLTLSAAAQERSVFVDDIDRNVDACTHFFDYANGAWRDARSGELRTADVSPADKHASRVRSVPGS